MKQTNRNMLIYFVAVTLLDFALIFIGVRFVLNNPISYQNILSFSILSLILGSVSTALFYLKWKAACIIFNLGLAAGFFEMYRMFIKDLDGWGDLTGLISLFSATVLGLGIGLLVQFVIYFYNKYRSENGNDD
ncbi:hypothetical protein [Sinanaerobacter chloroacetimidivorans]|jgi:hypothetical protein|uniref:Uncharacterized protein n=1 Tax=Sinanaerobacter chloroacetimidivorans TaxID=2818044 RepID=A0A8J7VX52_9FIRM|nr:hypothetical protein [Sinanaerobacter chloroacetimidivorans]MBR0596669.1 hypothetical protein [Sinanaerobacter chloroacetimidivorans]